MPEALDIQAAIADLKSVKQGLKGRFDIPKHGLTTLNCQDSYSSCEFHTIEEDVGVLIFEGNFALENAEIRELLDMFVFVDADPDECLARRIRRESDGKVRKSANGNSILKMCF